MYSQTNNTKSKDLFINQVKLKYEQNELSLGTFVHINSNESLESIARSGFDYVILDAEHGCFSYESMSNLVQTAENNTCTALVRIAEINRSTIQRTLDTGAKGLIVPFVDSLEQIQSLIKLGKFSPLGQRGYCPTRSSGWGSDEWSKNGLDYMRILNEEILIIPQCETKWAYENIDTILNMDGVDGIFIGPLDLSIALGMPFELDSKRLKNAIKDVLNACKKYKKLAFIFAGSIEKVHEYKELGFDSVAYSLDALIFIKACSDSVNACKK